MEINKVTEIILKEARENGADCPVDYGDAEQIAKAIIKEYTWQTIETAPKDKMLILSISPHNGFLECPIKVGGFWNGRWNVFGASWGPTHWMPLPSGPSQP